MTIFLMFSLIQYLTNGIEIAGMDALMKERIKQRMEEIMQPGSKFMEKINMKTQEMMHPKSKYMEKINKRLGKLPG